MKISIPWNIIFKSFQNQATADELSKLEQWLAESIENENLFAEAFNIYMISDAAPEPVLPNLEKAWQKINQRVFQRRKTIKQWLFIMRYAAVVTAILCVGLIASWLVFSAKNNEILQQLTEIIAPMGQKSKVVLPDSSVVWLNSGSSLKYYGNFNVSDREVVLNGEAYFEVHKNKSKKFRVKTGILNVDVYGTAFNLKNYDDDDFQEITVAEGRVGIAVNSAEIKQMVAGDKALLNKTTNKITFTKDNPQIISAWKNNELIFDNTPLEDVVKYLERWYGVNITIDSAMKGKHSYTFNVKTESFREMLEMMKVMTPLIYEINGKEVKIKYAN